MTDQELVNFLEVNEIGVGDFLEIHYNRFYPEVLYGNVVLAQLQYGGKTINTQVGAINLPEERWYLILHNDKVGVFGISSVNVKRLKLLERRGITTTVYNAIIKEQDIKLGDVMVLVDVENNVQLANMFDSKLQRDDDGDEFFKILNANGVFNCYLQGLISIRKGK
jgi:hypothetical protein